MKNYVKGDFVFNDSVDIAKLLHRSPLTIIKFGAEGSSSTSTTYVSISDSDIAINPANYLIESKLYVRFKYHIGLSGGSGTRIANARVLRQNATTAVTGSEVTVDADTGTWNFATTSWIDWSSESGDESYQIQLKSDNVANTVKYNSVIMELSTYPY